MLAKGAKSGKRCQFSRLRSLWILIPVRRTGEDAIKKMRRALDEFVIEGIKTTIPFHIQLMKDEKFVSGEYTTKFMETFEMN